MGDCQQLFRVLEKMNTLATIPVHKTGFDVDDDHEESAMTESIFFFFMKIMMVMMGVQRSHSQAKLSKTGFLLFLFFSFLGTPTSDY